MKVSRPIRIIPKLDVKGPNLVKGIHLEGLRVLGKPEDFAYQYYIDGADEVIYIDVVASLYGRNNLLDIVRRTAERVFIPLTVGGGIRTVEDIRDVLRAGADKVAINTAAIQKPSLIKDGTRIFGSQCIVISIEARKKSKGVYEAYTDNGRQETGVDVFKWARMACELGAGEILITSIDRDGTGEGYDIDLISKISDIVSIPVIACGGAGKLEDIEEIIERTKISALSAASIFHYNYISKESSIEKYKEGNITFLREYAKTGNYKFERIQPLSISELRLKLGDSIEASLRPIISHKISEDQQLKNSFAGSGIGKPLVAVIDFGCGNLFSIVHVLKEIEARFTVSSEPKIIEQADRLLLPGVGAFGEGIRQLKRRGLIELIKEEVRMGKPLLGICLGMQLLMSESEEFGLHKGLDLIKGKVVKFKASAGQDGILKIPHIGWGAVRPCSVNGKDVQDLWAKSILKDVPEGSYMYFVHSYVAIPDNSDRILAESKYGDTIFCSVIHHDNIWGCQFHPEKSGEVGLSIYRQFVMEVI